MWQLIWQPGLLQAASSYHAKVERMQEIDPGRLEWSHPLVVPCPGAPSGKSSQHRRSSPSPRTLTSRLQPQASSLLRSRLGTQPHSNQPGRIWELMGGRQLARLQWGSPRPTARRLKKELWSLGV